MATLAESKQGLRRAVKSLLRNLSAEQKAAQSAAVCASVVQQPWFAHARTLAVYIHCAKLSEVDTTVIVDHALTAGKRVYVPLVEDKERNMRMLHLDTWDALKSVPPYGIMEPLTTYADGSPREDLLHSKEKLDLVLLPGLAFNRNGNRLGRGGGYYDNFVTKCLDRAAAQGHQSPLFVALSFDVQLVKEDIPMASYDRRVDKIVIADEVINCQ